MQSALAGHMRNMHYNNVSDQSSLATARCDNSPARAQPPQDTHNQHLLPRQHRSRNPHASPTRLPTPPLPPASHQEPLGAAATGCRPHCRHCCQPPAGLASRPCCCCCCCCRRLPVLQDARSCIATTEVCFSFKGGLGPATKVPRQKLIHPAGKVQAVRGAGEAVTLVCGASAGTDL